MSTPSPEPTGEEEGETEEVKTLKMFGCELCGKSFPSASKLSRHELVHTGHKPFKCPICSSRFTQNSSLRTHAKLRHTEDERRMFASRCAPDPTAPVDKFWGVPKKYLKVEGATEPVQAPRQSMRARRSTRKYETGCSDEALTGLLTSPPDVLARPRKRSKHDSHKYEHKKGKQPIITSKASTVPTSPMTPIGISMMHAQAAQAAAAAAGAPFMNAPMSAFGPMTPWMMSPWGSFPSFYPQQLAAAAAAAQMPFPTASVSVPVPVPVVTAEAVEDRVR